MLGTNHTKAFATNTGSILIKCTKAIPYHPKQRLETGSYLNRGPTSSGDGQKWNRLFDLHMVKW